MACCGVVCCGVRAHLWASTAVGPRPYPPYTCAQSASQSVSQAGRQAQEPDEAAAGRSCAERSHQAGTITDTQLPAAPNGCGHTPMQQDGTAWRCMYMALWAPWPAVAAWHCLQLLPRTVNRFHHPAQLRRRKRRMCHVRSQHTSRQRKSATPHQPLPSQVQRDNTCDCNQPTTPPPPPPLPPLPHLQDVVRCCHKAHVQHAPHAGGTVKSEGADRVVDLPRMPGRLRWERG